MAKFNSILIANRGEIAVRIIRTAKALGYRTVAVWSDADRDAPHVRLADDAVHIGPSPAGQSYLDGARIIEAARASGAQAIHPGYGFLSENAGFAEACAVAGLVFIGPPASAIAAMGNKGEAKRRMIAAGVPCVPGYEGEDQSDSVFAAEADRIGYPVMVKAAAGGGGRGMRLVGDAANLAKALATAHSEAENAFGSGELILEKAITRPRHVEMQVFCDDHGTIIHMGERDCSVQRRHQKVIEEAPCPVMTPDLRERMGAAAVEAARAVGYRGAGTVEFLLDGDDAFYFLEMNTRLQVEHPVTEMITGLDLVALQITVAQGEPLGLSQDDIVLDGHAIEARLYAEDPAQDFLPQTGRIALWCPSAGEGVRIDSGVETGQEISPFYDPMVAKIIACGPTREIARNRLVKALKKTVLFGLRTNAAFLTEILERPAFAAGEATTAFIGEEFGDGIPGADPDFQEAAIAAVLHFRALRDAAMAKAVGVPPLLAEWSSGGSLVTPFDHASGEARHALTVQPLGRDRYRVAGETGETAVAIGADGDGGMVADTGGRRLGVAVMIAGPGLLDVAIGGRAFGFRNLIGLGGEAEAMAGGGHVTAPMHGVVIGVFVTPGDVVQPGARLLVLEAMKMQHEITASIAGEVKAVACAPGTQVGADDLLVEIEPIVKDDTGAGESAV
ncbi:MAG: acetyl-CoA carboxylase biotin carboxylase subunit [Notoacmeibacter sp.]|nr:acetyl-CoA carboxylase biotin carboxylase subunit [Notoacmeibacter sp.]